MKRAYIAGTTLCLVFGFTAYPQTPPPDKPKTRQTFAQAMAKVEAGMSKADVLALLGKPDDILTTDDVFTSQDSLRELNGIIEVWSYGTNGHGTFATLGCVHINMQDKVLSVFGGNSLPAASLRIFKEDELRDLLRLLDTATATCGGPSNPLQVIRIVNRLQTLGKEKALDVVQEYARVVADTFRTGDSLSCILSVLFDVPEDTPLARPRWPVTSLDVLKDPHLIPRFPMLVVDDIPLCVYQHANGIWIPMDIAVCVNYYREYGQIRAKPLVPSDQPLHVLGKFPQQVLDYLEKYPFPNMNSKTAVQEQLARLVYSVYHQKGIWWQDGLIERRGYWVKGDRWEQTVAAVDKLHIRWDAGKQQYTFRDGTVLPPPPLYKPLIWQQRIADVDVKITFSRTDEEMVFSEESFSPIGSTRLQKLPIVKVFSLKNQRSPLATNLVGDEGMERFLKEVGELRHLSGPDFQLPPGEEIQIQLSLGGKVILSPVFKP